MIVVEFERGDGDLRHGDAPDGTVSHWELPRASWSRADTDDSGDDAETVQAIDCKEGRMTQRLLVVDWDYFFPQKEVGSGVPMSEWSLFDWGHSEDNPAFSLPIVWDMRAAGFLRRGLELPGTSGEEEGFWNRFSFSKDTKVLVRDSNAFAYNADWNPQQVWLFDAHHDSGYQPNAIETIVEHGHVTCEDWMLAYHIRGAKLHVRYPRHRAYALDLEPTPEVDVDRQVDDPSAGLPGTFHNVYICRSGAWVPPWLDQAFLAFVEACPIPASRRAVDRSVEPREWSLDAAQQYADLTADVEARALKKEGW